MPNNKTANNNTEMSDEFVDKLLEVVRQLQLHGMSNETLLQLLRHELTGIEE